MERERTVDDQAAPEPAWSDWVAAVALVVACAAAALAQLFSH